MLQQDIILRSHRRDKQEDNERYKKNKTRTMLVLAITAALSSSLVSTTFANAQLSQPTPEGQLALEQLRQDFARIEQILLQLPPDQQQAAIFDLQQRTMAGFIITPPELIPQTIQMLQLAMSPQLAQAVLYPVLAQLQVGQQIQQQPSQQQTPMLPPPSNTVSAPGCVGPTNSPSVNESICRANSVMSGINPENQASKDDAYSPPLTPQELRDKCTTQAISSNLDPNSYCDGIFQLCDDNGFTIEECYAYNLIKENVPVPDNIKNGIEQKVAARVAYEDALYNATMCPARDGTFGEYCFQ